MKKICFFSLLGLLFLIWCGNQQEKQVITFDSYQISYVASPLLTGRSLDSEDEETLRAVYVETGAKGFTDTLLISETYNQGKGIVAFSQDAFAAIEARGVTLEAQKEQTFLIDCRGEQVPFRLISALITSGLSAEIPNLYLVTLFMLQSTNTMVIWSYTTEQYRNQQQLLDAFRGIQCLS